MKRVIRNVRKLFSLSTGEITLLFEAIASIYIVKILILILPFRIVRKLVTSHNCSARSANGPESLKIIEPIKYAVRRGRTAVLWRRSFCLVNAIAAQWMLSRRGCASELILGVAKSGSKLSAHAWLRSGGVEVVGFEESAGYVPVASF